MPLYKFCKREHLDAFLSQGQMHLGTLHSYRTDETAGSMVADPLEGVKRIGGTIDELTAETLKDYPGLIDFMSVKGPAPVTNLKLEKIYISSPDFYIFSCSKQYSAELHDHWRQSEGYDACYKIRSPKRFFRAISDAIEEIAVFLGYRHMVYYDSDTDLDVRSPAAGLHPACLKGGKDFGAQAEVRGFWRPLSTGEIRPLSLCVPNAVRY